MDLRLLNAFRTPAQIRLILEEFFWLETGIALGQAHLQRGDIDAAMPLFAHAVARAEAALGLGHRTTIAAARGLGEAHLERDPSLATRWLQRAFEAAAHGKVEPITRGDVAFIQSIVETGWFRFGGSVQPSYNNFSGLGATDSGGAPAQFPNARTGVRAQIQHLRAYADATAKTCTVPPLHYPCVDPRFNLVSPKGKAPTWNQMGNGNWATSTTYAQQILSLYSQMLAFNGVS